jgi:hypothetical protein
VVSVYGLVLWLGRVKDVPWIYLIWGVGGLVNHLISRVWSSSTLLIHSALLGYSVAAIVPFAWVILFLRPPVWLSTLLEVLSILWSSSAAILSYSMIFSLSAETKPRLNLLFPCVVMMEVYFVSLLPIRHYY